MTDSSSAIVHICPKPIQTQGREMVDPRIDDAASTEALPSMIFLMRLEQLDVVRKRGEREKEKEIRTIIKKDIRSLPVHSVGVIEKRDKINRALSTQFWDNVCLDPLHYLKIHIVPLMTFKEEDDRKESSFILMCERLGLAALENDREEIDQLRSSICEMIERLPRTLDDVKRERETLNMTMSHSFWEKVSYEDSRRIIVELAPLMKHLSTDE